MTDEGIRLESSEGHPPLTTVAAVNDAMAPMGSRVWPLDLRSTPTDIRRLLRRPTLAQAEVERVKAHFVLSRERLLKVIEDAGRRPHVPGGGALTTFVSSQGYAYPQVWIVQDGVDYTRFDRFHVNVAADSTGVDEVLQILSGKGVVIHQRSPSGAVLTLHLDCPGEDAGWLVTYNGGNPHIGSLSGAEPGTKVIVQAIGPARWVVRYEDDVR